MDQKELNKEGITKEFINSLNIKNLGNPVQLLPKDEIVTLLKCSNGFWISLDGEMLKDHKNNYLVISDREALIGRARYLLNFKDKILEHKINSEIDRLKSLVDQKLDNTISNIKECLTYAGVLPKDGLTSICHSIMAGGSNLEVNKSDYEDKVAKAKELADEHTIDLYDKLLHQKNLNENKDYNSLYSFLFQNNSFEIASFNTENEKDINTMLRFFHRDKIEKTIIEIQSTEHLYNVARFNIEKTNL